MQDYFYRLADSLFGKLKGEEYLLCSFSGEDSDFVRFNKSLIRQAGSVNQRSLTIKLVRGRRQAVGEATLSGNFTTDRELSAGFLLDLREVLSDLPEDPHLHYSQQVNSSEHIRENTLPDRQAEIVEGIMASGVGRDLVGFYALGGIYEGFANSLDQRNWFATHTYNIDFSLYSDAVRAVKMADAGFIWNGRAFQKKVEAGLAQLHALKRPQKTLEPGRYRVYLAPSAVSEIIDLLNWGAFGLKDSKTKQTPLIKMTEEGVKLHPSVSFIENTQNGIAANFQEDGFLKPGQVRLITKGAISEMLVCPRSAKEFATASNGASPWESAESIEMMPGNLESDSILQVLDRGIYINNLWYLNYSDRAACRMTGMTRFAVFWVENGEIQGPTNVMRFDESLYRFLGSNLAGITKEREFLLDSTTYHSRSTDSRRLPGILVEDFALTL